LIARNTALQLDMGDKIFTADRLPLLDPETSSKPVNLSQDYGDLCLVADGFAQVYPEHKYLIVECLRELGYVCSLHVVCKILFCLTWLRLHRLFFLFVIFVLFLDNRRLV
jgi:hypothetical protein